VERPTIGTRGGIILLWDERVVELSNITTTKFCLSASVHVINSNGEGDFKITVVYGPTASNRKDDVFRGANLSKTSEWGAVACPWRFQPNQKG
jgi:hypothetical protein